MMPWNVPLILAAMRADCIQEGESGRWRVEKLVLTQARAKRWTADNPGRLFVAGDYTFLRCLTMETMMNGGETVMEDSEHELRKHLDFIRRARGRVLVTGLGLGCVVRGLLACGKADSITVVERSEDVLKLCRASVGHPKVQIVEKDATSGFVRGEWDYAWHDVWNDPEKSEPHLQLIHAALISQFRDRVKCWQGAWKSPTVVKRIVKHFYSGSAR